MKRRIEVLSSTKAHNTDIIMLEVRNAYGIRWQKAIHNVIDEIKQNQSLYYVRTNGKCVPLTTSEDIPDPMLSMSLTQALDLLSSK